MLHQDNSIATGQDILRYRKMWPAQVKLALAVQEFLHHFGRIHDNPSSRADKYREAIPVIYDQLNLIR